MSLAEELKERIDIVEFISRYVKLKKSGSNYFGLCPFHAEKTPSFSVNPEKKFFHCFGCGESGDVITFYMKIENIDFKEAVRELADQYGIKLHEYRDSTSTLFQIHEHVNRIFKEELIKDKDAMEYLKSRGVDEKTIDTFDLGVAKSSEEIAKRMLREFSHEDLIKSGIFIDGKYGLYSRFEGRITFPIKDSQGRISGFGGRTFRNSDRRPKYINSPETPIFSKKKILYGFYEARESAKRKNSFIVTEGYFDCIRLHSSGLKNTVATLGTALSQYHIHMLSRYCENLYFNYDADKAGFSAMKRSAPVVLSSPMKAFVVVLEKDEDPDSFILKHGVERYVEKLTKSTPYFDYIIEFLKNSYDFEKPTERANAIGELKEIIYSIRDPVIRSGYITKVAKLLNISEDLLSMKQSTPSIMFQNLNKRKAVLGLLARDIDLMGWIDSPEEFEEYFTNGELELYKIIKGCYYNNVNLDSVISKSNPEVSKLFYEIMSNEHILALTEKSMARESLIYLTKELEKERLTKALMEMRKNYRGEKSFLNEYNKILNKLKELTGDGIA